MNEMSLVYSLQLFDSFLLLLMFYLPFFLTGKQTLFLAGYFLLIIPIVIYASPYVSIVFITLFYVMRFAIIKKRFNSWIVPTLAFLCTFTFVSFIWLITFDLPRIMFSYSLILDNTFIVVSSIIRIFIIVSMCVFSNYLDKKYQLTAIFYTVKKQGKGLSLTVLFLSFLVWGTHQFFFYPKDTPSFFIGSLLVLVFGSLFSIVLYSILLSFRQNIEYKRLSIELTNINKVYETTYEFQHDFKNILSSIKGYLDEEQLLSAQQYVDSIIKYSSLELAPDYYYQLSKINVIPIRSILSIYAEKIALEQIDYQVTIRDYITHVDVDVIDIVRCLSILLNNAYEAVQSQKEGTIRITAYRQSNSTVFKIENSIFTNLPIFKLTKRGYTNKKDSSGLGLYIISKMTKKYTGLDFFIAIENDIFSAKLIITD
jgi:two-component system sensor histidine kinase AgrC